MTTKTKKLSKKEVLKEKFADIKWDVTHYGPIGTARDRYWDMRAVFDNASKGWNNIDRCSAGDRFVLRLADILETLSHMKYEPGHDQWVAHLIEAANTFRGYLASNELQEMYLDDGFHIVAEGKREPVEVLSVISEQTKEHFMTEWAWVGDNVFSRDFVAPIEFQRAKPIPVKRSPWDDQYMSTYEAPRNAWLKTEDRLRIIGNSMGRLVSKRNFTDIDLAGMPFNELDRFSDILSAMARSSYGNPYKYLTDGYSLRKREDDWEDRQAIAAWLLGPISHLDELSEPAGDGTSTIKKNRDVGSDYSAWIEDITYAAKVLHKYAAWHNADGLRTALEYAGAGTTEINDIEQRLYEEFRKVWIWIGENVWSLWD